MIVIVDYGLGNHGSVKNMLRKCGVDAKISSDVEEILNANKLILPGVGSFDHGMQKLTEFGFVEPLNKKVLYDKIPVLGICLGMQLLTQGSEEGSLSGLGWINGHTRHLGNLHKEANVSRELKIPHMGWNCTLAKKEHPLVVGLDDDTRFYFVHSYYVDCINKGNILMETFYGSPFASAVCNDNIMGVQFHPEKSHKYGMRLLKNFAEM